MRLLESLLVGLGYSYDDKGLKQYKEDVETVNASIVKLTKVAVGAATALTGIVVTSTAATDTIGKLAGELELSVETVDALNFALERSGGTAAGMESSLRGISRRASEAARGIGEGVEAFSLLNINVTDSNGRLKTSEQLLREVSNGMQGLDNARQIELAEKLGVTGSIKLLQQGSGEIDKLTARAKALGTITEEDAAIAADFQDALTDLWRIVRNLGRTITREVAPAMTELANGFSDWFIVNKALIDQGIELLFSATAIAADNLNVILIALGAAAALKGLALVASLLRIVRVRILAATVAALILPALLGAAVIAFVALVEDAYGFFEGKESLLGEIMGNHPEHRAALETIAAIFATIGATVVKILEGWREIIRLAKNFSGENVAEVARNIPGFLLDSAGLRTVEGDGLFDFNRGDTTNDNPPRPPGDYGVYVGTIKMDINGGGDPETTGRATREALSQQYDNLRGTIDQ